MGMCVREKQKTIIETENALICFFIDTKIYIWQKLFIYKYQTHFFVYKLNKKP